MTTLIVSTETMPLPTGSEESNNKNKVPKKKSKGHRCYFCGQRFMDKNILRKHISVHKDRDFFCDVCGKAFSASWGLRKHMKTHTGERPFICEQCGKAFVQKCTLQFHIKAIHGNKAHPRCKSCGKRLKSFSYEQCWLCRYEGKEIIDDDQHSLLNTDQNAQVELVQLTEPQNLEINSSLCLSDREKEPDSEEHREIVIQTIPLVYNVNVSSGSCNVTYPGSIELKREKVDNEPLCAAFICDHCGLRLTDSMSMQQHLLTHPNLKPFVCQKCGRDFEKSYNLKQHMVTHKEDRPYICKICKSSFKSIPCLRQHLVTHSQDRPYLCKDCGSRFKSMQGLKTHVLIHNKVKPLSCKTCGKTFTFLGNLQRHFRIHTGERPYKCKFCDKRFSQSNGLKAHELTHQKTCRLLEEFCNTCGRKFRSLSNFKKHILVCN